MVRGDSIHSFLVETFMTPSLLFICFQLGCTSFHSSFTSLINQITGVYQLIIIVMYIQIERQISSDVTGFISGGRLAFGFSPYVKIK